MKRLSTKNEIICDSSLKDIINEIQDCKKLLIKYSNKNTLTKKKINNKTTLTKNKINNKK